MTARDYFEGDNTSGQSPYGGTPQRPDSQSFDRSQQPSYGYGSPPPQNYPTPYQQAPSDCNRPRSPYQQQPWDGAPSSSKDDQQHFKQRPYHNDAYPEQPPYPSPQPPPYNQQGSYDQPWPQTSSPPQDPYAQKRPHSPLPPTGHAMEQQNERGLLGAVAGGTVGAYAGHKVNHGFLGTIGGAIAGSLAEDAIKKKKKDKKNKEEKHKKKENKWGFGNRRRSSSSMSSSSSSSSSDGKHSKQVARPSAQILPGNFSASSNDIRLEQNDDLVAYCRDVSGRMQRSSLSLNSVLSNSFGNFNWTRGGNFGASARNIRLNEDGRVLEAELDDGRGGWNWASVRLDERITNQNGNLVFLD